MWEDSGQNGRSGEFSRLPRLAVRSHSADPSTWTCHRIHCFENVTALFFVVAISEYNQVLSEDESTNRMLESMTLFESISNSRWFSNSGVLLFLKYVAELSFSQRRGSLALNAPSADLTSLTSALYSKTDLLEAKLRTTKFSDSFPDYQGANTLVEVQTFLLAKFKSLYRHQWRELFPHYTCATDSSQMRVVLAAVEQHIIVSNLAKSVSHSLLVVRPRADPLLLALRAFCRRPREPSYHMLHCTLSFFCLLETEQPARADFRRVPFYALRAPTANQVPWAAISHDIQFMLQAYRRRRRSCAPPPSSSFALPSPRMPCVH